jgi:hypothetical protein
VVVAIQVGLGQGLLGGGGGELGEPVRAAGLLSVHVGMGVESLYFGGYLGAESLSVEGGNPVDA